MQIPCTCNPGTEAHLPEVERRQRGPGGRGGPPASAQHRPVRLQRALQLQDVVDDVLQDLHAAEPPARRDGGHQAPQPAIAAAHVAAEPVRRVPPSRGQRFAGVGDARGPRRSQCLHRKDGTWSGNGEPARANDTQPVYKYKYTIQPVP